MKLLFGLFLVIFVVILQVTILPIFFKNIIPELLLILVFLARFVSPSGRVLAYALFGGVLVDVVSGGIVGSTSFILLVALFASQIFSASFKFSILQMALFIMLSSATLRIISLHSLAYPKLILAGSLTDTLIFLILFPISKWLIELLYGRRMEDILT
ncbi:hypothetical protein A3A70_03160 [candidate division WWE3 bacterium RIFCSPLOWO2_01_FULL_42_11]|uniref:Uncharacterized protein n=1 Tax=candidate division WWE3 bacterium RIFCSPLOWO2_01_FULL_42_11 TaxID=1802627 RepID=A0A1F4VLX5_UNCKA|nr:MAG: hypothetical protein A3A70_03160 [candidate division WWE3 bacterium RIFCSPLOWO2_01_FULL_42_11]